MRKPLRRRAAVTPIMQHYCGLIAAELLSWPTVSSRRMFGLTLFYRGDLPFVALPDTKDFRASDSVGFKLHRMSTTERKRLLSDDHIAWRSGARWITFALREDEDLTTFLHWAEKAYSSCRPS